MDEPLEPRVLELGCGANPTEGAWHHDRTIHDEWVDEAWDLEKIPWPWEKDSWDVVWALDVFEHLDLEVNEWLRECWRIMRPKGLLRLRVPAFDSPLAWRDPTHRRLFHPQTFDYFDPESELWEDFGRYYFEGKNWWRVVSVFRQDDIVSGDFRFDLEKRAWAPSR